MPDNGNEISTVDIDLSKSPRASGSLDADNLTQPMYRESVAREVAIQLIGIFRWSMLGAFVVIVLLIILAMRSTSNSLSNVDALLRILQLIGTIFSPLLAFILGYYFGTPHHSDKGGSKSD